jgi:HD superfamily phosphohydrolase YqeK
MDQPTPVEDAFALHPVVAAAAEGRLPDWTVAGAARRAHMARVAALLDSWAEASGLPDRERARWRAVGHLHDALRDASPAVLRALVPDQAGEVSDELLHGPAAAERLRADGVADEELLAVVAFHTTGDAGFGKLGRALYAADYLEPGRGFMTERRAELRALAPGDLDAVTREVARARMANLEESMPSHPRTVAFLGRLEAEGHE